MKTLLTLTLIYVVLFSAPIVTTERHLEKKTEEILPAVVQTRPCECADKMLLKNRLIQLEIAIKEYEKQKIQIGANQYTSDNYKKLVSTIDALRKIVRLERIEEDYEASIDSSTCEVSKYYKARRTEKNVTNPRLMNGCLLKSLDSKMDVSKKNCDRWKLSGGDSDYWEGKKMADVIQELIFGYSAEIRFIKEQLKELKCPCDGKWHGTVTYKHVVTFTSNETITPPNPKPAASSDGGSKSQNRTITQNGTVTVSGNEGLADSSAEENFVSNESTSGKFECSRRGVAPGQPTPLVAHSSKVSMVSYGGGSAQGNLSAGISLDKDDYQISIKPLTINGTLQSTTESSSSGGCPPSKPSTSFSNSSNTQYGSSDHIVGKGKYGADRNVLSGGDTKTTTIPMSSKPTGGHGLPTSTITGSITTVTTITWNLRRCDK